MPFPEGLDVPLVHYTATNPVGGGPGQGTIRFTPAAPAIRIDGTDMLFTGSGTYQLDNQGRLVDPDSDDLLGVRLLPNDLPGTNPADWLWLAVVSITGSTPYAFYFALPSTPDDVRLEELQQLDPALPIYVPVTGPAGPTGAAGAAGTAGEDGQDGAAGASAYQVAVANGFVGNTAAWLASLVGPEGDPGPARPALLWVDGQPDNSLGIDGDSAISPGERRIYGPKASGAWTAWSHVTAPADTGWQRNGFAALDGDDLYLTHAADGFGSGTCWRTTLEPTDGLDVTFTVEMSGGTGADGVTFALADPATAATFQGGGGGDLGLIGCTAAALALDTGGGSRARLVTTDADSMDVVAAYGGALDLRTAPVTVRALYEDGAMSVWLDGVLAFDEVAVAAPASARIGWTGANGGANDDHIVRAVAFVPRGGIQL